MQKLILRKIDYLYMLKMRCLIYQIDSIKKSSGVISGDQSRYFTASYSHNQLGSFIQIEFDYLLMVCDDFNSFAFLREKFEDFLKLFAYFNSFFYCRPVKSMRRKTEKWVK